ncbi:Spo0E family sporulation regulatory protein-aspartic acid phosphatase [Paenibacillus sp. GCM10027628]|uniref:Spo0E family sporulation regulatory protein-aspartic acid phosphatase n=1 Tax=Paenibacillus sp. GCM10027628 TaxID=3273413 RepID=UPI003630EEFC
MEQILLAKIESLRLLMVEEAFVQRSLTHENVIALSRRLDRYIAFYQKRKKKTSQFAAAN